MINLAGKTVWILSPSLPPVICGAGAHTAKLARELAVLQPNCRWQIHTTKRSDISHDNLFPDTSSISIFPEFSTWKGSIFLQDFEKALTANPPDTVILQYLPHLYDRLGINLDICKAVSILNQKGIPAYAIVHEMYVDFDRHIKHWITSPIQRWMMKKLLCSVNGAFLTTLYRQNILKKQYPTFADRIFYLPVTTNIDLFPISSEEKNTLKSQYCSSSKKEKLLIVWGMLHDSKCLLWTLRALQELKKNNIAFQLVYIGPDQAVLEKIINTNFDDLKDHVHMTGPVSEKLVSHYLQIVDLLLYPLDDGASTRRGGLMAAIQHGTPVITTQGVSTDDVLSRCPNINFAIDEKDFINETVKLVQQNVIKDMEQSAAMQQFFKVHYTWDIIAKTLLKSIEDTEKVSFFEKNRGRGAAPE